jgi:starch synthase (maltosyl-transferring)
VKKDGRRKTEDGRPRRVIIEHVTPQIDEGRFPAKRTLGEAVVVEADVFADGHDAIATILLWRRCGDRTWTEVPMKPLGNDRWRAAFTVADRRDHDFTVEGWVDRVATWRDGLEKRSPPVRTSRAAVEKKALPGRRPQPRTRFPRELR